MTEWWSYRPSDFLMFSPRVYYRQIESFNLSLWPLHLLLMAIGVGLIVLVIRGGPSQQRLVSVVFAALWLFVGWAYLWSHLSSINWAATYAAGGFVVEAILIIVVSLMPRNGSTSNAPGYFGIAVMAAALFGYPCLSIIADRGFGSSEVFGIMPDPTAIATIAFLAATRQRYYAVLLIAPVLWCSVSSTTLYTMHNATWWVPITMCVLGVLAASIPQRKT